MAPKKKGAKAAAKDEADTTEPTVEESEKAEEKAEVTAEEKPEAKAEEKKEAKAEEKSEAKADEDAEMKDSAVEAKDEVKPEEPKEPEKPKFVEEEDAPTDKRKKINADDCELNTAEATLNCLPTANSKLLMTLNEGGCQYLLAGIRGTAGVKSGRYMFEARIIESLNPSEPQNRPDSQSKPPHPKQLVRVGLSLAGSSVIMADGVESVYFDSEANFVHQRKRTKNGKRFSRGMTVALVLNLEEGSTHANTVSLFLDGERASEPQALPEGLLGKVLYPTVTYKNVTLQLNLGPTPLVPLPFACRMVKDAAAADVELSKAVSPKDGKYEVLFPVGLPDQGVFDWADGFLAKNPQYTELSDRKIIDWAQRSGVHRPKGNAGKGSNDKPEMNFGIPNLDDLSVRNVLSTISPTLKRNLVVMELKGNLLAAERKESLIRFGSPEFKKVGMVLMGEPDAAHKAKVQEALIAEKQAKVEVEKKKKAQEQERARALAEKKKKAEEARKARAQKAGKEDEEKKEDGVDNEEENKEEEAKMEDDAPIDLTAEEKNLWHRPSATKDLTEMDLAKNFASFTIPDKSEGFDEIKFVWQKNNECAAHLKNWMLELKKTQRAEDLKPGEWFQQQWGEWQKSLSAWRKVQSEWKDPAKKKALIAKKKEDAKKKAEEAGAEAPEEPMDIDVEELDVFGVEDVVDIGTAEPLFANFVYEDWALLSARFELHLLVRAFAKDLNDPDRPGFGENHLPFYYSKYFKKAFNVKYFGVTKLAEFVELVKETLSMAESTGFLEAPLAEDTPASMFVKHTEEHRRERERRVDAGDETAKLKFERPAAQPQRQQQQGSHPAPGRPAPGRGGPPPQKGGGYGRPAPGGGGATYGAQKRSYSSGAPPPYPPAQRPRTGPPPPARYGGYSGGAAPGGYRPAPAPAAGYYRR